MSGLLAVSFHTPHEPYLRYAGRLRKSCEAAGLDSLIVEIDGKGSWVENCAMKGPFILKCMQVHARPLLWIDADAVVLQYPDLLEDPIADFAVYARPGHGRRQVNVVGRKPYRLPEHWPPDLEPRYFNSGTVYFSNRKPAVECLRRWAELCGEKPRDWDQWHLQQAWAETQPPTLWLPHSYCAIHGRCRGEPVISHDLASVRQKGIDRG